MTHSTARNYTATGSFAKLASPSSKPFDATKIVEAFGNVVWLPSSKFAKLPSSKPFDAAKIIKAFDNVVWLHCLDPDRDQLTQFVTALFKYATPGNYVSLRSFPDKKGEKASKITPHKLNGNFGALIDLAFKDADIAANANERTVFCPPIATFTNSKHAGEADLAEGPVISVECDEHAQQGRDKLEGLLGPATVVVQSGGEWIDPDTGEVLPRLHVHYRLKIPARGEDALKKLKLARKLATAIVGSDISSIPAVHPIRWPGSWHRKKSPKLCHIVALNDDAEVDLDAALEILKAAAPDDVEVELKPGKAFKSRGPVNIAKLRDALAAIPNDEVNWPEWKNMALRIYSGVQGEIGFGIFQEWSQKCVYDPSAERQCWNEVAGCPPDRTGVEKIYKIAREEYGWQWGVEPTFPASTYTDVEAAQSETERLVDEFLAKVLEQREPDDLPIAMAMMLTTGVGKTSITIKRLAKWLRSGVDLTGPVIYAVPRHKLGEKIEEQFAEYGMRAIVFRGRTADDPENPKQQMCLNPKAVALAGRAHADITKTCCVDGKKKCRFFDRCGYFRQMPEKGEKVDVFIVASDMLFHTQKVFGKPVAVIIDEGIWQKGIRGVEREKNEIEWGFGINSLMHENGDTLGRDEFGGLDFSLLDDVGMRDFYRHSLGEALKKQKTNGGVILWQRTDGGVTFEIDVCADFGSVISREWRLMPKIEDIMQPGMSAAEIRKLEKNDIIDTIQHTRRVNRVWDELRRLERKDVEVSGRLTLKRKNGQRVIEWRGVERISKQFWVPTLMFDATLPALEILKIYHPQVEVIANIDVAMPPHVRVRQVLHAPTSSIKLNNEKHLIEVCRYIMRRWLETGRQKTLVIAQQKVDEYLKECGLPDEIKIEHFNNISGIDVYRDVRLQILIGGTAPGPEAMEALAGALSGAQPKLAEPSGPNGYTWYDNIKRGIRLSDGSGVETDCNQHPDAFVESVRWLVNEGEQIQAIGRSRGIYRKADTPLDIDLLFNNCLPITVNEVVNWQTPNACIEMVIEGAVLTSRVDMVKAWPSIWKNDTAARRTQEQIKKDLMFGKLVADWQIVTYQPVGPKMKLRTGYFDIPDPKTWLEQRLGPLKVYREGGPEFGEGE